MTNPLRSALDHIVIVIVVGTLGPGVLHAIYEYVESGGEVGVGSIWIAVTCGSITAACLLALKVRQLGQEIEQLKRSQQSSVPDPPEVVLPRSMDAIEPDQVGTDTPVEAVLDVPEQLGRGKLWCPRTADELRDMSKGKTSVQRQIMWQSYVDMWLRVDGTLQNASPPGLDGQVRAIIRTTLGALIMVTPESESCARLLTALNVGDSVSIHGQIKYSEYVGDFIYLENCELA